MSVNYTDLEDGYPPSVGKYKVLIEGNNSREDIASWDGEGFSTTVLKDNEWITSWAHL